VRVKLDLPCEPGSVGRARDALDRFGDHVDERRMGDLRLLVSEVVTNAVRHAGMDPDDTILLEIADGAGGSVRVEVSDSGSGFIPKQRDPDLERPGGWGLYLVEELADRWGVETGGRTLVWFELAA
jgi:anti-sigma regulatory factor (Ser/Thr protein kinase)